MNIHPCRTMRLAEQALFDSGAIGSGDLMDAAISSALAQLSQDPDLCAAASRFSEVVVYAGKGKNAGDAIGLAREMGFSPISIRGVVPLRKMAPETCQQALRIPKDELVHIHDMPYSPPGGILIIDGLLGSGAAGALRAEYAELAAEINALRAENPLNLVLSIDIPTGLDADTGQADEAAVQADITLAIGCVKPGMLADGAERYVGRLVCAPLPEVELPESSAQVADSSLQTLLPRRPYSYYKNQAGRVRIIAGSPGYTGAAELCAEAALAAGAGLVELCCLPSTYSILAARVSAEVMVRPLQSYAEVSASGADALVVGPGLGQPDAANTAALRELVEHCPCPLVLDADGLNLAATQGWRISPHCILTPHPGEMRKLYPAAAHMSRAECAAAFVQERPCTLLLKGARTIITNGCATWYNSTGGPHMATGGQGDALSGAIAAYAAQGLSPLHAALLGAYSCGRAADIARATQGYPISVRPSSILAYLTTPTLPH